MAEASRSLRAIANWRFAVSVHLPAFICGLLSRELMKALLPSLGLWTVPVSFLAMGVVSVLMGVGIHWLIRRRRPTDAEPSAAADPAS